MARYCEACERTTAGFTEVIVSWYSLLIIDSGGFLNEGLVRFGEPHVAADGIRLAYAARR